MHAQSNKNRKPRNNGITYKIQINEPSTERQEKKAKEKHLKISFQLYYIIIIVIIIMRMTVAHWL